MRQAGLTRPMRLKVMTMMNPKSVQVKMLM
jgi:hypothetical protein